MRPYRRALRDAPAITNKNVSFVDNPICWVFYIFLFLFMRIILAGFSISSAAAWTIVNWAHGLVTFFPFHWVKGSPFANDQTQSPVDQLTFWEQVDDSVQYTRARKFLTIFPLVLFFIAVDSSGFELAYIWINLIITAVILVPKLPLMHKVRIFGINS